MFRNLKDITKDNKLRITIYNNEMYVNIYEEILIFEDSRILLKTQNKLVKIIGKNLKITRLNESELLVEGSIKQVDLGD